MKKSKGKNQGNRIVSAFGENIEGHSVLLCRFLTAQKFPPNLTVNFE
jgi:hypothetical protein